MAEDDHAARQNVCASHDNGNRHQLVSAAQIIIGPEANALAAVNVHRIFHDQTHAFGHVIFHARAENSKPPYFLE